MALGVSLDPTKKVYRHTILRSRVKNTNRFNEALMDLHGGVAWGYQASYTNSLILVETNTKGLDVVKKLEEKGVLK